MSSTPSEIILLVSKNASVETFVSGAIENVSSSFCASVTFAGSHESHGALRYHSSSVTRWVISSFVGLPT